MQNVHSLRHTASEIVTGVFGQSITKSMHMHVGLNRLFLEEHTLNDHKINK